MKNKLLLFVFIIFLSFVGVNSVRADSEVCYYRLSTSWQEIRVGIELDKKNKTNKASVFYFMQISDNKTWVDVDKTTSPLPKIGEGMNMDRWGETTGCPDEVYLHRNSAWGSWWYHVSVDGTDLNKEGEWFTLSRVTLYPVQDGSGNFMEKGWEQILTGKTLYDESKIFKVFYHRDKGIVYDWGGRLIIDDVSNSGNFVKKFTDSDGIHAYYVFDFTNSGYKGEGATILINSGVASSLQGVKSACDNYSLSGNNYTCIIHPEFRLQDGEIVDPEPELEEKLLKSCTYEGKGTALFYLVQNDNTNPNCYKFDFSGGNFTDDEKNTFMTISGYFVSCPAYALTDPAKLELECPMLHPQKPVINPGDKVYGCEVIPKEIREWIISTLNLIKYLCLALVIVLGTLDFIKAAASGEADAMKKSGQSFLKRIIAVAILFLLPVLIELILNLIDIYGVNKNNPLCQ
ncbi:MAG: hypothetical protein E7165_02120 [Firmicutes bacterium]|nr:hypothetical protein [Bacillota bacterium]